MLLDTEKKLFLLGKNLDGTYYWLAEPSWDCGWYWGFGYIQSFTNNTHPDLARDMKSHEHIEAYMGEVGENGERIYNISDFPHLNGGKTFNKKKSWELSELFTQFYTLRKSADLFYLKSSYIASTSVKHDESECDRMYNYINQIMMPAIFKRIEDILTPSENER